MWAIDDYISIWLEWRMLSWILIKILIVCNDLWTMGNLLYNVRCHWGSYLVHLWGRHKQTSGLDWFFHFFPEGHERRSPGIPLHAGLVQVLSEAEAPSQMRGPQQRTQRAFHQGSFLRLSLCAIYFFLGFWFLWFTFSPYYFRLTGDRGIRLFSIFIILFALYSLFILFSFLILRALWRSLRILHGPSLSFKLPG